MSTFFNDNYVKVIGTLSDANKKALLDNKALEIFFGDNKGIIAVTVDANTNTISCDTDFGGYAEYSFDHIIDAAKQMGPISLCVREYMDVYFKREHKSIMVDFISYDTKTVYFVGGYKMPFEYFLNKEYLSVNDWY